MILFSGGVNSEMGGGEVLVPWEHWVCTQCLQDKPYAVWLIKLKCFKPGYRDHNYPISKTLVSIDPRTMELVQLRLLPSCVWNIRGKFSYCRYITNCSNGSCCTYAHSSVEQDTWNFKKSLLQGILYMCLSTPVLIQCYELLLYPFTTDEQLTIMIRKAGIVPHSPAKVCVKCYDEADAHNNTRWLPWLECAQPDNHRHEDRIIVIVSDDHRVVEVDDIPSHLLEHNPSKLQRFLCRGCSDENECHLAHSKEELDYWKWSNVQRRLEKVQSDKYYISDQYLH